MLTRLDRFAVHASVALFAMLGFTTTAFAATAVTDPDSSLLDLAKPVLDAVLAGHGWLAAAGALILAAAGARRYLAPKVPFFATAAGAVVLVFVGAYGGAVITGLAAAGTSTLTATLAYAALKVALAASGGYAALRPIIVDLVEPFVVSRFPFLKPLFDLLSWAFDSSDVVKQAEHAGDDAVVKTPGTGASGVVGTPTEIE